MLVKREEGLRVYIIHTTLKLMYLCVCVCVCVLVSVHVTCLISVSSVTIVSRRCGGGGGGLRNAPASLTTGSNAASERMKAVPVKMFIFI